MFAPARVFKNPIMYKLISDIAERGYNSATKRGKDASCLGCMQYLAVELAEYWKAVENDAYVPNFNETTAKATELSDEDFNALYAEKIHNTITDELADIVIVAATWLHAAKLAGGDNFQAEKSIDVMLLSGAVQFVCGRITGPVDLEELRTVVNLKLRYNETRND